MHDLEVIDRLNREIVEGRPKKNPLRFHPRIQALRDQINGMKFDCQYRAGLFVSLDRYAHQIVERSICSSGDCWDDLEALQQVSLGDAFEASIQRMCLVWDKQETISEEGDANRVSQAEKVTVNARSVPLYIDQYERRNDDALLY